MKTTTAVPTRVLDLVLVGTGEDIAALTAIARNAGTLIFRSAPTAADDGRQRVFLRLHLHHR
ncbi:hypothetical protein GA0070609_5195 [Micromonospora echinaurantiaca]|uniref:Uncharacterized protein n=1 Tax=Micromonospora echinaurantiaca TaxID=47857 RepID=A0A1C5JZL4_9ACTN|nr:hypothetical protein [Micromonospora echinaurantiaca]SCG76005.1 hypothetical protein GA0070609_5195 [Micromonospora echinaurantiaca]